MTSKLIYRKNYNELTLVNGTSGGGEIDTTASLPAGQMKLKSNGDLQVYDVDEGYDIIYDKSPTKSPDTGTIGGDYGTYTQANISVSSRERNTIAGNRYGYVIKRAPDIASSNTWGGMRLFPDPTTLRTDGKKFRFSYDYRGYSGGYGMQNYIAYTVGWSSNGVNLTSPWSSTISAFDTWEWQHFSYEFTVSNTYLNWVAGAYDWNSTTQYPSGGDYGIRYNGNLYRKRDARPAPTLGTDPETEWVNNPTTGAYDAKYTGGAAAGYFNLYNDLKIGFTYQAQNARGTHVHIDNLELTEITEPTYTSRFKYDRSIDTLLADRIVEGTEITATGTAGVGQARSDDGTDVFAVEGNRAVTVNGSSTGVATGRGLQLTVVNGSTFGIVSNTTYDIHDSGTAADNLASAINSVANGNYWILTSYDAIGTELLHDNNPNLRNLLVNAGSFMWKKGYGTIYLWNTNAADVRNTYAAIGINTAGTPRLIKEDGSGASDSTYKRKAYLRVRV